MQELISALDNQSLMTINKNNNYLVNTFTDHIPSTNPVVLRQAIDAIRKTIGKYFSRDYKIVGEEERGGYISACVALTMGLSFCLAKQNPCRMPGELGITFKTTYKENMGMYLNGLSSKDTVIIIDDMIDTGGTMIAMIKTLQRIDVKIIKAIALIERVEKKGINRIKDETGIDVETIIKVDTSGKKSVVVNKEDLLNSYLPYE